MYKALIWGIGNYFCSNFPLVKKVLANNNINIVAGIDKTIKQSNVLDRIITPSDIEYEIFDYIIIGSKDHYDEIYNDIINLGIPKNKIINYAIFMNDDFDFLLYNNNKWINDDLPDYRLTNLSFYDAERQYKTRNINIYLGRKSYVADAFMDTGGNDAPMVIDIGNFTSISWGVLFELGLNLDHNYSRVTNYGYTHLFEDYRIPDQGVHTIKIGSDVWIGKNATIKSGIKIGDGAVIASHSVVVSNVPDFAIVGGNPARIIKYRFSEDIISKLQEIRWWDWPIEEILKYRDLFETPELFTAKF